MFQSERYDILCCIQNLKATKKNNNPSLLYQFFEKWLSPTLLSLPVRPAVVVFFTTILALSVMFIPSIEIGLDQSLSMPKVLTVYIYYVFISLKTVTLDCPSYFVQFINNS